MVSQFLAGRKHVLDSHQPRTALQIVGQFYPLSARRGVHPIHSLGTHHMGRNPHCRRLQKAGAASNPIHPTQAPLSSQRWLVRLDRITGILGFGKYRLIDGIRDYKLMPFLLSTGLLPFSHVLAISLQPRYSSTEYAE